MNGLSERASDGGQASYYYYYPSKPGCARYERYFFFFLFFQEACFGNPGRPVKDGSRVEPRSLRTKVGGRVV